MDSLRWLAVFQNSTNNMWDLDFLNACHCGSCLVILYNSSDWIHLTLCLTRSFVDKYGLSNLR